MEVTDERQGDVVNTPRWLDLNADEGPEDVALPVEVRVKQGMALLDAKHGPEWVERINVDTLYMSSPCDCVVGQLFGGYYDDDARRFFGRDSAYATTDTEKDCGFWATADGGYGRRAAEEYAALTTAWKHAILARRLEQAT